MLAILSKNRRKYLLLIFVALIVISVDGIILILQVINSNRHQAFIHTSNKIVKPAVSSLPHSTPVTAATNPLAVMQPPAAQLARYQAPATHPKYIIIPKLGIDTRVLQVGLTATGAIDTPTDGYDTVWYSGSSLPGTAGATFIDGHVDGYYSPGVFYYLKDLVAGDIIHIVLGNNTTLTYVVQSLKTYSANNVDMHQVLSPINPNVSGLNLMTCTGQLIDNDTTFNQRLAVFSVLQT